MEGTPRWFNPSEKARDVPQTWPAARREADLVALWSLQRGGDHLPSGDPPGVLRVCLSKGAGAEGQGVQLDLAHALNLVLSAEATFLPHLESLNELLW